ncbi:MAG: peptidoglycan domain protein, partial [Muribaculaceae bacterium]|nr:peptidoglycan domain protein [Muribaculaceae bacterium]
RMMDESVARRRYHNRPTDKGGPTMCGVTISTFAEWRRRQGKTIPTIGDLRGLKYDEWLAILKTLFWDPCMADKIQNASVAMMLVDWRWVNGTQAVRDAQNAFSLIQDGIVGQKTLAALNTPPPEEVFMRMKYAREASYRKIADRNPSQRVFLKGWISRTNSIEFRS